MSRNPFSLPRLNAALVIVLLCANHAWAQTQSQDDSAFGTMQPIVVSPTLFPTPLDEIGSTVTLITSDQIDQKQQRTLPDVLRDVPGLFVIQSGGEGSPASVFMRGTNSNHTKVLIDGIDVSDPTTPAGSFDFSQILASDIDRVEVLRGPQSGLYGSDAIGGVIDIVTKQGSGPPQFTAMAEGGSFGTFNQTFNVSGSQGRATYAFDAAHLHYSDLPVTPPQLLSPGQAAIGDAYGDQSYSTKLGADLTDNVSASLVAHYANSVLRSTGENFTNFPVDVPDSTQSVLRENRILTRGSIHVLSLDGAIENEFGVAYGRFYSNSTSVDPPFSAPAVTNGDRVKYDWKGTAHLGNDRTLLLGLEQQTDRLINTPIIASTTTRSGYAEYHTPIIGQLYGNANLRVDQNDSFGRAITWRAAPAYSVPGTGTTLKASYGTGFKAPTLEQLFIDFPDPFYPFLANPNLRPETSRGYDAGFEQAVFDKKLDFGATYFHNHIHDLIQYTPLTNYATYTNIASATTYGAETFVALKPVKTVDLRADYTYTFAKDDMNGAEALLRRPKHKASLNATWTPIDPLSVTAEWLFTGACFDLNRDGTITGLHESSYSVVNLSANYRVDQHLTLIARINNLLDRTYQEPDGFLQPGFGIFAGVKLSWGGASGAN